ncbi:hypothetical protein McanMca71_007249 [Microsporum canis]
MQHQYQRLPTATSIRLLRIDGRDKFSPLECTLRTVDLDAAPPFHALSYTWGNPHASARDGHRFTQHYNALDAEYRFPSAGVPVKCDGQRLLVSRNLYDALRDVPADAWRTVLDRRSETRLHTHVDGEILVEAEGEAEADEAAAAAAASSASAGERPEEWLWVDQVCINQADADERSAQVDLMHRIYQQAAFTLVWLGREDGYTKRAAQLIPRLARAGSRLVDSSIVPYAPNGRELHASEGIPYVSEGEWDALAALFQRQYFRRLWVVQEVVLSGVVVAYCGGVEIPWRPFCVAAELLHSRQRRMGAAASARYVALGEGGRGIEQPVVQLLQWQDRFRSGSEDRQRAVSLENLVFDTWHFLATDPRDKIYGVYGLLNRAQAEAEAEAGERRRPRWRADYAKPVERVYAEATKRIILDAGELRILSAVLDHSWRKVASLPSWTPDYSVPWTNMMAAHANAAGSLPVPSPLIEDDDDDDDDDDGDDEAGRWGTLTVRGLQIGAVLAVGDTTSGPGDPRRFFDPSWLELALLVPSTYPRTGQRRSEALWRTLCANKGPDGLQPAPPSFGAEFADMVATMLVREAWVEEGRAAASPELNLAPSLGHGVERVLDIFSAPPLAQLERADLECEFGDPSRNLSSPDTQSLVYTLLKAHVLALTEPAGACSVPSISSLLDLEERLAAKKEDPSVGLSALLGQGGSLVGALQSTVGRRRLFVTRDRFLGLGPAGMAEGDEVWVLPGAGAAFVLRKTVGLQYKFIGESYVHGVMDGEAADGREDEVKRISLI